MDVRQGIFLISISIVVVLILKQLHNSAKISSHIITSLACTDTDIKDYFKANGVIPTGSWSGTGSEGHTIGGARFHPNLSCSILSLTMTSERLRSCFLPKNRNRILTFGDSNAKKYFNAIYHAINSSMACNLKHREYINKTTNTHEINSFLKPNATQHMQVDSFVKCWSCYSELYECSNRGRTLILEHIGSTTLMSERKSVADDDYQMSFNEFLFKHYLKNNYTYPNVLFVFPPFNHLCRTLHPKLRRKTVFNFVKLLHRYIPSSSKVYWITAFRQFEEKKTWSRGFAKYHGKLASEGIIELNQILVDVLKSRLSDPESNDFTMWDMMQTSEGMEAWSYDGIHMKPWWYTRMVQDFLHVHCNSLK
ncbi:hypothetical protein CAPTEDRAFT_205712 [Capitella teleta]|uniref:SGNH domain-containing protein n=1 Tax=Capitella teleta TaxID=283909 RepID=R7TTP4_CAPTE|nr:hypothetical protein CAPTEDRAFT_205712 [Capitella teleta]|eukprot:ELT97054.1 hypothetical protein CAPTEDRAFT_205712 [Capitella teleta]